MDEREIEKGVVDLSTIIGELAGCAELALEFITNENSDIDKDVFIETLRSSIDHFNRFMNEGDD